MFKGDSILVTSKHMQVLRSGFKSPQVLGFSGRRGLQLWAVFVCESLVLRIYWRWLCVCVCGLHSVIKNQLF